MCVPFSAHLTHCGLSTTATTLMPEDAAVCWCIVRWWAWRKWLKVSSVPVPSFGGAPRSAFLREVTCLRCGGSSENRSPPITQSRKARQSFAQDGQKGRACVNGEVQTQRAGSRTNLGTWRMSSSRPRQEICLAVRMQGRMCEPSGTCGSRGALVLALHVQWLMLKFCARPIVDTVFLASTASCC